MSFGDFDHVATFRIFTRISDYKSRLIQTQLLPLTYILDLNDVMFFIKSLHNHHDGFNINDYIKFATGNTLSTSSNKLHQTNLQTIPANTFTLIAYQESGTHYQLLTSTTIQQESKVNYQNTYGSIF